MASRPTFSPDVLAEVICALEAFRWFEGAYVLNGPDHPDAYLLAVVLNPFRMRQLVEAHYTLLKATHRRDVIGRILYANGESGLTVGHSIASHERIVLTASERVRAAKRVRERLAAPDHESDAIDPKDVEAAFLSLAEQAQRDVPPNTLDPINPYRDQQFIAARFDGTPAGGFLEIVNDPFPRPNHHILIVDDDEETARAAEAATLCFPDCAFEQVSDGWVAIERLAERSYDLVVCSVLLGELTGARIYRVAVKSNPDLASRFMFLASKAAVDQAPPASIAGGKVVSRPLDVDALRELVRRREEE